MKLKLELKLTNVSNLHCKQQNEIRAIQPSMNKLTNNLHNNIKRPLLNKCLQFPRLYTLHGRSHDYINVDNDPVIIVRDIGGRPDR